MNIVRSNIALQRNIRVKIRRVENTACRKLICAVFGLAMIVFVWPGDVCGQALQPLRSEVAPNQFKSIPANSNDHFDRQLQQTTSNVAADSSSPESAATDFATLIRRIATSTLAVIVACVVFLVGFKKFGRLKFDVAPPGHSSHSFRVLQTIRLGNRNCLQLIEADSSRFVVGVDPSGIKSIVAVTAFADHLEPADSRGETPDDLDADEAIFSMLRKRSVNLDMHSTATGR